MGASSPPRPPWKTSTAPPTKSLGVLGGLAIAVGAGVLGYFLLEGHKHTCASCGHSWRHLGTFSFGDPGAHTCAKCGTVQWWKDGFQHVFRDPGRPPDPPTSQAVPARQPQESRGAPDRGLVSETRESWPYPATKEYDR